MNKTRIIIADDHILVREGLKLILRKHSFIEIIGEASNGSEAIEQVKSLSPDLLLMDVSMPHMNGIEATKIIKKRSPNVKILLLSMHEVEEYVIQAFEAGADGYVLKEIESSELVMSINKVSSGEKYFSSSIYKVLVQSFLEKKQKKDKPKEAFLEILTSREKEVLEKIADGLSNKEIGEVLHISPRTVDAHRANIMEKLKVKNVVELVKLVIEKRLFN